MKAACQSSVFCEDLPASDVSNTADDELGSGLIDAVTIDIRTLTLSLTQLQRRNKKSFIIRTLYKYI